MLPDGGVAGLDPPHDLLLHPPAPGRRVQPPPVLRQGPGLGLPQLRAEPPCFLELQTKVHTKVRNHGEGPY